jgi:DNA-binding MurR/RpiR family transcriptional regulator
VKAVRATPPIREILERQYHRLSGQKRRAADYLIEHHRTAFSMSVHELARAASVSEATLVRLARDLGFGGYLELRSALVGEATRVLRPEDRFAFARPTGEPSETAVAVARQEVENINRTVEEIDPVALKSFVGHLRKAELTVAVGLGVSSVLARLAAYQLSQVGCRADFLTREALSLAEQVALLPRKTVVLAIAFPPYSTRTVDTARRARERGLVVLALTDSARSPLCTLAAAALYARTDNLLYTNSISGAVVVLNAVATDLALADKKRALANVAALNQALSDEVLMK